MYFASTDNLLKLFYLYQIKSHCLKYSIAVLAYSEVTNLDDQPIDQIYQYTKSFNGSAQHKAMSMEKIIIITTSLSVNTIDLK